jgi:hypothetical protein
VADHDLMTMADVLERLKGRMGRTNLIAHLQAHPVYAGGPTHRKNGRKILFTQGDYGRLIESLACPVAPPSKSFHAPARRRSTSAARSGESAYSKALALTTPRSPSNTGPS